MIPREGKLAKVADATGRGACRAAAEGRRGAPSTTAAARRQGLVLDLIVVVRSS